MVGFRVMRFFGWWFGFTGLSAMFAVCPCCGQQSCPAGVAGLGVIGAVSATIGRPLRAIANRLAGRRAR
ncbi:MAG TPA: hypothetical protein VLM89_06150 [Phycisphaerae bacterium]|nr:hypothetical protein [Phycisphaerae bacterium]